MTRTTTIQSTLKILIPEAWSPDQKGKFLEDIAGQVLRRQSYSVIERVRFTGMEIDLLATHKPSGDRVYVECKFHDRTIGAPVIDLMVGQAFRRRLTRLALFSAGPLGKDAQGAMDDLRSDERVSLAYYGPDNLLEALTDAHVVPRLPESLPADISHATCIVHPEHDYLWVLQQQSGGRPARLHVISASSNCDPVRVRDLLDEFGILAGLDVILFDDSGHKRTRRTREPQPMPQEVVSTVTTADDLIDYRPCNPADFVGRLALQKEIWDFLSSVRTGSTGTRILALVGASGAGKSSLVAKLAERFRNKKWRTTHFLFPVDVRSARGPLFVAEAVLAGIRAAAEAGFVPLPQNLSVPDIDNVLGGPAITTVLDDLKANDRVLVLFFDQFEEAFTKDELFPVFQSFRRLALDVNAKQENFVLGFSWRTGISLSDDNPAYQLWNELRDHRRTKHLGNFDAGESSRLISQFEAVLGTKLLPPLRRRLHEQGQGLPWFLKKLCIHVYKQVREGQQSQIDLVGSRLNVRALFDEDLEPLTEAQLSCLRYIAANSPADSLEVYDRYGNDIVANLLEKRLVIRAGPRFAVYWDIFRDYLTEGKVPFLPLTYLPSGTVGMSYAACSVLNREGPCSTALLAEKLGYSENTILNIVTDLQNLAITDKLPTGQHRLMPGLELNAVPDRVRSQLLEHVLYHELVRAAEEDGLLTRKAAIEVVRKLYAGSRVKATTRDNYFNRIAPWLEYAGLIEPTSNGIRIVTTESRGRKYGQPPGRRSRAFVFLGTATPTSTLSLLNELRATKVVDRPRIFTSSLRNAAADLVALDIARWTPAGLVLSGHIPTSIDSLEYLKHAVNAAQSIVILDTLVRQAPDTPRVDIGTQLSEQLGRPWKRSSGLRYVNGLWRYRELLND